MIVLRHFREKRGLTQVVLSKKSFVSQQLISKIEQGLVIVVLRYYDRKPLTEIAKIMGLSYGAVKLRHQNALMLLREQMAS